MQTIKLENKFYQYSLTVSEGGHLHHNYFLPAGFEQTPADRELKRIYPYEVALATADSQCLGWRFADGVLWNEANHDLVFRSVTQKGELTVITLFQEALQLEVELCYLCREDSPALQRWTRVINRSEAPCDLYHVSSFLLSGFPYFGSAEDLYLHSYASGWSIEGDERIDRFDHLGILAPGCRSVWSINNNSAYSTHREFPYFVVEERSSNLFWGIQLECGGQWRAELGGGDVANPNWLYLQGGLPNFWGSQWFKTLQPGEMLETPKASMTVAQGRIEQIYDQMHTHQLRHLIRQPEADRTLPVIFNDWQAMRGDTSEQRIGAQLDKLQQLGIEIYVTDAGWFTDPGENWSDMVGRWKSSDIRFPNGLSSISRQIREHGMIPGIWCEIEMAGPHSPYYNDPDMVLQCRGRFITQGPRRFLDFRNEKVRSYASDVFRMLYDNGFRYIKIDYNADCAPGCDGSEESPAENLRQVRKCYAQWLETILEAYPDLIIEHCASGGLKLDYDNLTRGSLASITDQWNYRLTSPILFNVSKLVHPVQCQVWSTLKPDMDLTTMAFTLTNSMSGRMCISGVVSEFEEDKQALIRQAVSFYQRHRNILCAPRIRYHSQPEKIMDPHPFHAMELLSQDGKTSMVWLSGSSFSGSFSFAPELQDFRIADAFPSTEGITEENGQICAESRQEQLFGRILILERSK